jgi:hypothetical protein
LLNSSFAEVCFVSFAGSDAAGPVFLAKGHPIPFLEGKTCDFAKTFFEFAPVLVSEPDVA